MRAIGSFALAFVIGVATAASWAQRVGRIIEPPNQGPQTPQAIPPTLPREYHAEDNKPVNFRSQTILVLVPVTVTDKSGAHVVGLKQEDFKLLENGKEQKVASCEEVAASSSRVQPPPPPTHGVTTNQLVGNAGPTNITVIALDLVNTPVLDQAYARGQIIKYLGQALDPQQPTAILLITGGGVRQVADFTTDPKLMIEAFRRVRGELPVMKAADTQALVANQETQAMAAGGFDLAAIDPRSTDGVISGVHARLQLFIENGDASVANYRQGLAILATM